MFLCTLINLSRIDMLAGGYLAQNNLIYSKYKLFLWPDQVRLRRLIYREI